MEKKTITVQEAAAELGVSRVMIRYLVDTGQMPGFTKKNAKRTSYIILRRAFDDWLAGRTESSK